MLLSDLGTHTMKDVIQPEAPPPLDLYLDAVETLVQWQKASREGVLPVYDRAFVMREMELFPQWYIAEYRQVTLDAAQRQVLDKSFAAIADSALAWPSVFMHRDFMPRNLMVSDGVASTTGKPSATRLGVLDFQDAVYGPITYDIASLLRDAFLSWEEDFCLDVTIRYWQKARKAGLPVGDDFGAFYQGVEWMGLQRHLKVAGIFARLTLRDGKPQYLADTPRFIAYIRSTCSRYMALKPLLRLVESIEGIEVPTAFVFGKF
jgi:aminoglycoside/choline kinase family phosphotransferase